MLAAITAVADCAWSSCNACSPDVQYKVLDTSTPAVAPLAHNVILLTMVHLVCSNAGSFATLRLCCISLQYWWTNRRQPHTMGKSSLSV